MLWSEFWSGRSAGANGPELWAKRSGVSSNAHLPISSGHIALAAGGWVSRRLALLQDLPEAIRERVRRGQIGAHGAAKYLVPLARANRPVCLDLMAATGATRLSSRDLGILYLAYQTGNWVTRQRLLEAPLVFLKSHKEMQATPLSVEPGPSDSLLTDLEILSATARRADRRLRAGMPTELTELTVLLIFSQKWDIKRLSPNIGPDTCNRSGFERHDSLATNRLIRNVLNLPLRRATPVHAIEMV